MASEIVVALLSLAGTLAGSLLGVVTSNRLTLYRIQQLEEKVNKHNTLVERTAIVERDLKTAFRYIDDMREDQKK